MSWCLQGLAQNLCTYCISATSLVIYNYFLGISQIPCVYATYCTGTKVYYFKVRGNAMVTYVTFWGIRPTLNAIISWLIYFTYQFCHRSSMIPKPSLSTTKSFQKFDICTLYNRKMVFMLHFLNMHKMLCFLLCSVHITNFWMFYFFAE